MRSHAYMQLLCSLHFCSSAGARGYPFPESKVLCMIDCCHKHFHSSMTGGTSVARLEVEARVATWDAGRFPGLLTHFLFPAGHAR